ncbi:MULTISPECIES: PepSY-associated TM helix domain-containing protein [Methylomonas]|uniref:Peptidase n=2 Tax=Methylomonas TaxID=416 RepID=A0A126T590_9GAMM|nr:MULTISPECIES: PepSY-associated TM helix domain-containing protein [Methylomonas]AMK77220.1 peptidase [Methylomonas denitrificans]OAI05934.1 peptidase [Methylomonas methanica]TCV78993.1 putative iron-regulated membrane protein [Methylomonas methanica]
MKIRPFWVLVHRYAGLAMTVFLIIVGLTGSLLAFYSELEHLISPQLSAPASAMPRLSPPLLQAQAERLVPQGKINSVWLEHDAAHVDVAPRTDPATGQPYELGFTQLILNPYTGEELGRRNWGAISEGWINLMPFVYKLHYALALDEIGGWILGITALVWTLDCFVGFYLTLPISKRSKVSAMRGEQRSFWRRWAPAWLVKWHGSSFRVNFDLHRAGGLWLWAMLLVFAWSSVFMNLSDTVYAPVTRAVFTDYHEPWIDFPDLDKPLKHPPIAWSDAYRIAANMMEQASSQQGFVIEAQQGFRYNPAKGFYVYTVRSSLDVEDKHGSTRLVIDATTGAQKLLILPTGQYAGNTVSSWLAALHMADVFGMPYRIFVCLLGLAIVMLSVTGVVIWQKKRRARLQKAVLREEV